MAYEGMDFKEWIGEYPVHPVASLFPMIDDDALNALAEDIKKNGQREPIVIAFLDDDQMDEPVVIDGRNRFKACEIAGVEPKFQNDRILMPADIGPWIISHNLHRRHLTTSQKAMVGQGYLAFLKEDAKRRQVEAGENYGRGAKVPPKSVEPKRAHENESAVQAAQLVGVGKNSIRDADFVVRHDPDLAEQVRDDKIKVSAAAKAIREKLNPKPELTPEQLAEKKLRPLLKEDEAVIEAAFSILAEILGKEI